MKIAVLGTRGIPTKQGGVERHVEELYQRIAKKHEVTVYCRSSYVDDDISEYKGIKLRRLPHLNTKHLDAITHTFLASIDSIFRRYDIVHFHSIGPSLLSFIPKIKRKTKIVATVHALDWQRDKWSSTAKMILKSGEKASVVFPDLTICVSKEMKSYLNKKHNKAATYIPNGINDPIFRDSSEIKKFSLEKKKYVLFLGRLVPEKNCHLLIEAFKNLDLDLTLAIAGDATHSNGYHGKLKELAGDDKRIVFTGVVGGRLLQELYSNALIYVLPSNLEGLPVTLLEAMSYKIPTLCSDIGPNLEVVGDNKYATVFKSDDLKDLKKKLALMVSDNNGLKQKAANAQKHVINTYDWDKIADQTENSFKEILNS